MRVICDAPGQTCNRLWTYVATVARCIAEHRRMAIIFFDWTIEDFPNLLHCPFIWFPLWHKWYLERGNGWNNYKGLTWKVTHSKAWNRLFRILGFTKGWDTMTDARYLAQTKDELRRIFAPREDITNKAEQFIARIRKDHDLVIGIHIRHGDYKTFVHGRFFYTLEEYHQFMLRLRDAFPGQRPAFFISSNVAFSTDIFTGCDCYRFDNEPSGDILDLHTLSLCDKIVGPWSTYSRWASFIADVPLCYLKSKDQTFSPDSFSVITDFYHFQNGESTINFWLKRGEYAE